MKQEFLPKGLEKRKYYQPTGRGFEKTISERLELGDGDKGK